MQIKKLCTIRTKFIFCRTILCCPKLIPSFLCVDSGAVNLQPIDTNLSIDWVSIDIDCHELSIPSIGYHDIIVVLVWVFLEKEGGEEAGAWGAWLWPVLSEPPRLWNPSFSFWEASFLLSHSSFANTFGSESRLAVAWLPGLPS